MVIAPTYRARVTRRYIVLPTVTDARQHLDEAYGQRSTVNGELVEHQRGIWFGLAAYVFWGLTPIYWNLITTDAASLLLHRIVWSVPILLLIVTERRQWLVFRDGYATWRPRLITALAGGLLTINWGLYVWAVTNGHIVEASLGYFINPLVSVALGVLVLKEKLRPLQWTAVGIAALGVILMGVLSGVPPWISLTLAFSFGLYGLLKKRDITPPPVVSLFGETLVLFLPALIILVFVAEPQGATFGSSPGATVFFIGAGLVTVIPLLLFGASAKRIPLATLGFLQYIAPTLQLLVGVVVFKESMTRAELIGFSAVWVALAIFVWTGVMNQERTSRTVDLIADT
jgi:chloramphenicol-sensitive protein RarD